MSTSTPSRRLPVQPLSRRFVTIPVTATTTAAAAATARSPSPLSPHIKFHEPPPPSRNPLRGTPFKEPLPGLSISWPTSRSSAPVSRRLILQIPVDPSRPPRHSCGDILTKKKLDPHRNRCQGATFTCIDCMVHFPGVQYRQHTSCMTEDQKYQGALYKDKTKKPNANTPTPATYQDSSNNNGNYNDSNNYKNQNSNNSYNNQNDNNGYNSQNGNSYTNQNDNNNYNNYTEHMNSSSYNNSYSNNKRVMAQQAYVEDCGEDREYDWNEYEDQSDDGNSLVGPPPEAPTPPAAHIEDHVDVFDFLVATGQTPNASNLSLPQGQPTPEAVQSTSLVRFESKEEEFLDPTSFMEDDVLVEYGSGPVLAGEFITPAPKTERRKSKEGDSKKDKKRKRLHVEVPGDEVMTDAPPVLHSGLTGGINRMMRPIFPPSPDYSGGDVPEVSPASPLKKSKHTKHSKHTKNGQVSHSIFGMLSGPSKTKTKKRKTSKKHSSHGHKEDKPAKLIEYRPRSKDGKAEPGDSHLVLFKPRADVFLSFVNKGPESERGCSMNKALKRFHRERQATGSNMGKSMEEKELWRSLRLRQNDRGEIVLFSIED
ncbi:hypothetical protein G7046_g3465 [Stylonectria norvegica]|nr:hypothetical protein G7046_g3465 [Stylonectria norvegica]